MNGEHSMQRDSPNTSLTPMSANSVLTTERIRELCTKLLVTKDGPEFDRVMMELANAIDIYEDTVEARLTAVRQSEQAQSR